MKSPELRKCSCGYFPHVYKIDALTEDLCCNYKARFISYCVRCPVCDHSTPHVEEFEGGLETAVRIWNELNSACSK